MATEYQNPGPSRDEIDASHGPLVLEFGTDWCGYCQGAQSHIADALAGYAGVPHTKVEDGTGRPLGRSFRVKLWPTVIALRDGKEVARVVRPSSSDEIRQALASLAKPAG